MNGYRKMEYTNLWFLKASFLMKCFVHNILFIEAGLPGYITAQAMKTGKTKYSDPCGTRRDFGGWQHCILYDGPYKIAHIIAGSSADIWKVCRKRGCSTQ